MAPIGPSVSKLAAIDPQELAAGEERRHHRGGHPRPLQQTPEHRVLGRAVEDDDLSRIEHPATIGVSERMVTERSPPLPTGPPRHAVPGRRARGTGGTSVGGDDGTDGWSTTVTGGRPDDRHDRPQRGVGWAACPRSRPGDQLAEVRVPQVDRRLVAVGDRRHGVGQQLDQLAQVGHPGDALREREQGPGGGVAALGVGEYPEDVEGHGGVLGEQLEHLGLRRRVDRPRGEELGQTAVEQVGRGDVDDEPRAPVVIGVVTPQLGCGHLGLVRLEAAGVDLERHARPDPDHQQVPVGGDHRIGPRRDLGEERGDVVAHQLAGRSRRRLRSGRSSG